MGPNGGRGYKHMFIYQEQRKVCSFIPYSLPFFCSPALDILHLLRSTKQEICAFQNIQLATHQEDQTEIDSQGHALKAVMQRII